MPGDQQKAASFAADCNRGLLGGQVGIALHKSRLLAFHNVFPANLILAAAAVRRSACFPARISFALADTPLRLVMLLLLLLRKVVAVLSIIRPLPAAVFLPPVATALLRSLLA